MRCRSRRICFTLAVALFMALIALISGGCGEEYQPSDPATLLAYVERYIELLSTGDEAGLREHLAAPNGPHDAADRIKAYRRLGLHEPQVILPGDELFPDHYTVIITATTSDGKTVTFKEWIEWDPPDEIVPRWHWGMSPLHALDEKLLGSWIETTSNGGSVMRIENLRREEEEDVVQVVYRRFYPSPEKFFQSRNFGDGRLAYATDLESMTADVIVYDYASDTITITNGSTGSSYTLARSRP